jgi:predicted DsbA family dithiol-disulfide isomerase
MEEIQVEYYTDPLCSWSWALEPHWRRLQEELRGRLSWRYRMGGMLADWTSYHDPLNAVASAAQMAPQWFYVRQEAGTRLDERIWMEDPPASSYPACLAFKAAELQGAEAADGYLRRLREAVMLQRRNIARGEVLLQLAEEAAAAGELDHERFQFDLDADGAREAFREDLKEARYRGIGRFPALILRHTGGRAVLLIGYRPYEALIEAVQRLQAQAAADGVHANP